MTYDEFFAEAKRLKLRMISDDPAEVRAALDAKDDEIDRLRAALAGLLEIEDARIQTGAFKPNTEAQQRIDAARAVLPKPTVSAQTVPVHKMPLCDCADQGFYCRGRQPGKACMAKDAWYRRPCDDGKCPGAGHSNCCGRGNSDSSGDET